MPRRIFLILSLAFTMLFSSAAWGQPRELPARIVTLGGPAELYKKGTPTWTSAALRAEVGEGDSVRTQTGGRVTIKTGSGQALRLGSRSQIALPPATEGAPTRVRFDYGWLWVAALPGGGAGDPHGGRAARRGWRGASGAAGAGRA